MDCTIRVVRTKALISFAVTAKVTAKLICVFVFAYAKTGFLMTRLIYFKVLNTFYYEGIFEIRGS